MKFLIIYFSGTGNTQLLSEQIRQRLTKLGNDVELVSIENKDALSNLDFTDKIIGFGYPVYKFTYPDIYNTILPLINNLAIDNMYFQFSSYTRFAADALYDFSKQLNKNKFKLIAQSEFKCPSCGISARLPIDDYEYQSVMFFEDSIDKKLDNFVNEIVENAEGKINVRSKVSHFSNLKKKIVANVELTKYPKLAINTDKCIVCGLCARECPDNNLINKQTYIDVADDTGCLHCLRCINHCPKNAITFGRLTEGANQYTIKTRDKLYEKSANGHKEKYWQNFDKIISKWRKKTLWYWITHFYRSK